LLVASEAQIPARWISVEAIASSALDSAIDLGPVSSSQRLSLTLTLAQTPERTAALDRLLAEQVIPSSPNYRKWITPLEFAERYGATPDQVAAATAWLQAQGLSVESVSPSATRIEVSGFPAQVQSAFAVKIHLVQVGGRAYFASINQPSLPAEQAALLCGIEGLDDLPGPSLSSLAAMVDANSMPILTLQHAANGRLSASTIAAYKALFRQAAAQGIATIAEASSGDPYDLAEVTVIADAGDAAPFLSPAEPRPAWQVAAGLPADGLRHSPDLTITTAEAFASTLSSIASSVPSGRLGNINPVLYQLAPEPGVFTQPDAAAPGTWEPATGLGAINLAAFAKAFPRGTGSSYASLAVSNYSPVHGQSVTFTSNVTSGTGGGVPTGTVSFVASTGATIGTATLTGGTASYTTNTLTGGTYIVSASYSGDGSYAPANSPTGTLIVQPEPSQLTAAVSTGSVVGGVYSVAVTDTSGSGVGVPSGNVTLMISGTSSTFTQALTPQGTNSAAATFVIPATTVGTLTLSINCSGDASFSCYSALTKTVTVAKATPVLTFSFSPNPVVSGGTVTLNATLGAIGTAPVPTGTVTFFDGTTVLNAGTLANGATSATGIVPSTATHTVTATYNGDPNYNMVSSSGSSSAGAATLTATLVANSGAPGSPVTVTGTVTLQGTGPSGLIVAAVSGSSGATTFSANLAAAGMNSATFSIPVTIPSVAGSYTVSVGCAPGDSFTCNTVSLPLTSTTALKIATTTVLTLNPANPAAGSPTLLSASVTPATVGSAAISGTISFFDGTALLGTGPVVSGVATASVTLSGSATHALTAVYSGDGNYAPSTSAPVTVSAAALPVSVTLTVGALSGVAGSNVTLTAQVSGLPTVTSPTGTVSFYLANATFLGKAALSPSGAGLAAATFNTIAIPAGAQSVYAVYSGDSVFSSGTSPSVAVGSSDYSIVFTPPNITLTAGQTGNMTLQVNTTGSFSGGVAFACIPPVNTEITCSISPATITGAGSATLSILTVAPRLRAANDHAGSELMKGIACAGLLCLLLPGGKRRRLPGLLILLLAMSLTTGLGCSSTVALSPVPTGGTPKGTVNLTIDTAGTSGSGSVNHDYSYQVTIQ
jgi:hypothetical protein